MTITALRRLLTAGALALAATSAAAAAEPQGMQSRLDDLAHQWAHVTYEVGDEDMQETGMQALADKAAAVVADYPDRAEPLIWNAVIASSEAKYAGMFGALDYAKQSRDLLEKAGRLDYRAMNGAIPTSLGALYYLVPGFPLGFGDNDKARQYLEQGVKMSPDGLDSNYFYGDFLADQGDYDGAATVLKHALAAPADTARPVWDAGRRAEIRDLLSTVNAKLASSE